MGCVYLLIKCLSDLRTRRTFHRLEMCHRNPIFGLILVLSFLFSTTNASVGDRSKFFINCVRGCLSQNCSDGKFTTYNKISSFSHVFIRKNILDGLTYQAGLPIKQEFFHKLLFWSCSDECRLVCFKLKSNSF